MVLAPSYQEWLLIVVLQAYHSGGIYSCLAKFASSFTALILVQLASDEITFWAFFLKAKLLHFPIHLMVVLL